MSLLEEVKQFEKDWRSGDDWKYWSNIRSFEDVVREEFDVIAGPDTVDTWRWGTVEQLVIQRGDEYVAVTNQEASGDGESEWLPEIFSVVPEATVKYVRVASPARV